MAGAVAATGADAPRTAADIEAELASIEAAEHEQLLDKGTDTGDEEAERLAEEALLNGSGNGNPDPEAVRIAAEAEAGRKGWVPKDKYKGDPSKWVDAATFNARGERFASNLQREVESLRKQLEDFKGTAAAFAKFSDEQLTKKNEELKEAISTLRIQRAEALHEGDATLVVELEDRIDLLKDQQKETKEVVKEAETRREGPDLADPVVLDWIEEGNQWFNDDPKLMAYAVRIGEQLIKDGEKVKGRPFLDKVAAEMRVQFPRRFRDHDKRYGLNGETADAARQNAVEGVPQGGASTAAKKYNGKSEKDLPAEDLKLMKQFIEEGWTTKDKFLTSYFAKNG